MSNSRDVLITAGATRNPIDRMRHVTANSSGGTGVALARALCGQQAVHLLGSPEAVLRARGLEPLSPEIFGSTRDLMARMETWVVGHPSGVVVHAAAVGDYETEASDTKIESGRAAWTVTFHPTPKIADRLKVWSPELRLVTFKAASPESTWDGVAELARRQLERTRSDLVFGNILDRLEEGVLLVDRAGERFFASRDHALAALVSWIQAA